MSWRDLLVRDPKVCAGALTARGTRVLARSIVDSLAEGATREEILRSFPALRPEHVAAAAAHAADDLAARR